MAITLGIGSDIVRSYKRLSYSPWHALAEFVDNSTQSYFNNRAALDAALASEGEPLEVRIVYDRENGVLRISDNAMGMDESELVTALKIGSPPADVSGRSQYGMGMKTAACWFGNHWTVATTKLGASDGFKVTVDVERVASGDLALPTVPLRREAAQHGTIVEITQLHTRLHGRTVGKIKEFLSSMYRVDLRNGTLKLYWDVEELTWDNNLVFLANSLGQAYRKEFEFEIGGKRAWGYVGILGQGSSGRPRAGFSILRRGRVIRGHPEAWRPEEIFGQLQGSNNLINQRITGELNLDEFDVSHTKDDILWEGDEESEVQLALKEISIDFIGIAKIPRRSADTGGPSEAEVQTAVDELQGELESREFVDLLEVDAVPPPEIIERSNAPILAVAEREQPRFRITMGEAILSAYISTQESPNDPYFATEVHDNSILVVINQRHPHWSQLVGSEGVLNHLRHCVYDAVAEWQCRRLQANLQPDTIKALKDKLLRLPSAIERDAPPPTGGRTS